MKRSRVFLSLTTCILAFAALAASKKYNSNTVCYTTGGSAHTKVFVQKACSVLRIGNARVCTVHGHIAYTTINWAQKMYTSL
jgi:hypothetical protein